MRKSSQWSNSIGSLPSHVYIAWLHFTANFRFKLVSSAECGETVRSAVGTLRESYIQQRDQKQQVNQSSRENSVANANAKRRLRSSEVSSTASIKEWPDRGRSVDSGSIPFKHSDATTWRIALPCRHRRISRCESQPQPQLVSLPAALVVANSRVKRTLEYGVSRAEVLRFSIRALVASQSRPRSGQSSSSSSSFPSTTFYRSASLYRWRCAAADDGAGAWPSRRPASRAVPATFSFSTLLNWDQEQRDQRSCGAVHRSHPEIEDRHRGTRCPTR